MAGVLQLSENIAGVTILAFGNGSPDIFTSLVANEKERLVMFTELLGAGVFVTAIIAGSVVVFSPFRVQPKYFVRDASFYMLSAFWIAYIVFDDVIHVWEAASCVGIYVLFIVVVVLMQKAESRRDRRHKRIPTMRDPDALQAFVDNRQADGGATLHPRLPNKKLRSFDVTAKLDVAIAREMENRNRAGDRRQRGNETSDDGSTAGSEARPRGLWREFLYDANPLPIGGPEWREAGFLGKVLLVLRAPFMLFLQLGVPVVNETAYKRGWSRLLNCSQIALAPCLATLLLQGKGKLLS
ncbi:hypothetical protein QAD02_010615 [Eretmocerus hayati]|uniref:Uncharacterized protein n=1 Tax=Eretmocerus hayati TaxID=131215 RepID=A0ACC2NUC6_9HYME|nr:hypothetical protein QAD02_010615 [Eretmocerus hayati]